MKSNFYKKNFSKDFIDSGERTCIITEKIYSSCSDRICFNDIEVNGECSKLKSITFNHGYILENSLKISEIKDRKNFKRVQFTLRIPYVITMLDGKKIHKYLPDIFKDIVLSIPDARDEFDFKVITDTHSKLLCDLKQIKYFSSFSVGIYIITNVIGEVQLLIPILDFCPEPPICEEYIEENICDSFSDKTFPDFFPPQFHDVYPGDDEC